MGNIGEILSLMRKFTPKGQNAALKIMRRDREILDKSGGFLEMPARLAGTGELGALEKEMTGNSYLSENMHSIWAEWGTRTKIFDNPKFIEEYEQVESKACKKLFQNQAEFILPKKQKIIDFIEKQCKDTKLAKKLSESKTEAEIFGCYQEMYMDYLLPTIDTRIFKSKKLSDFQDAYKKSLKKGDLCLKFWKTMLVQPKDKQILEITDILKKKYGMKYVYLETPEAAKRMLKAVEYAKKKNIPLPQNVIMTSAFTIGDGQNIMTSNLEHTVFISTNTLTQHIKNIASKNKSNKYGEIIKNDVIAEETMDFSTPSDLHVILHEFEHSRNFTLTNIKIPKKHYPAVNGLMNYSRMSCNRVNDEVRNELLTKRDIMGLNKAENELLKLWA